MPKPNELLVGILDFFAILLPGAILTAILTPLLGQYVLGPLIPAPNSEGAVWATFLASSYFFGHLAFFVGSYVDPIYDKVRERRHPYGNASAYHAAKLVRDEFLLAHERDAINTFQWSRSVLLSICPPAAEDVHRLEADSKFFRSALVVCLVAAAAFAYRRQFMESGVALILMFPCFARYFERRLKSTTQAYSHVVSLYRLGKLRAPSQSERHDAAS